jgi:hypothetical protein
MQLFKYDRLSAWDVAYAVDMAIACLITYWIMVALHPVQLRIVLRGVRNFVGDCLYRLCVS